MYYSYSCPYCSKLFYVFSDSKEEAAKELYEGIDKHETQYGEDKKDPVLHEYDPATEEDTIYENLQESEQIPPGGYPIE
jgi:hypothetical protein